MAETSLLGFCTSFFDIKDKNSDIKCLLGECTNAFSTGILRNK